MGYGEYMLALLRPLGIFAPEPTSCSGAEIAAIGLELDAAASEADELLREAALPTAESWGLEKTEALLPWSPVSPTTAERRAALKALLNIKGGDFTLAAVSAALAGCGVTAQVSETEQAGTVSVCFPKLRGYPDGFERIQAIIEGIIPCHLAVEYQIIYPTWDELEAHGLIWSVLSGMTWDELEKFSWENER